MQVSSSRNTNNQVISDILDTIRLLFISEKKPFLQLKAILGFYPHNLKLYKLALKHKSVTFYEHEKEKEANGEKGKGKGEKRRARRKASESAQATPSEAVPKSTVTDINNERLEFLGDAILGAVVADILYRHYGKKQEGFLTSLRSKIVCRNSLNKLATDLGLDKLIHYIGAATTGHNSFMNGNAFEAFFGAIYLDRGYAYCYRFMEQRVFAHYIDIEKVAGQEANFKSRLIEWCQKYQFKVSFTQKESRDTKHNNIPMFHSSVYIEGIPCGTGEGYSKKESDQNAARQALKQVKSEKEHAGGIRKAIEGKWKARHSTKEKQNNA